MDIDNNLFASTKYFFGVICSMLGSYILWVYKKRTKRIESLTLGVNKLESDQRVADVEIKSIKDDIIEIKESVKEILRRI